MDSHAYFMEEAIECGRASVPLAGVNPAVGAVLVKNGAIIGSGFHHGPGTPHAEIEAMRRAAELTGDPTVARGADLYCSLEPCCHSGGGKRTPPCTEAIVGAGVARVFIACADPNPRVSGGGAAALRAGGIQVIEGLLADEAAPLIEAFSVSIREKRAFVRLKWAQSLDGRIACANGASKWITGPEARAEAHALRACHDAVLVGAGTLRADDPGLNVRLVPGRDPRRIVAAGKATLPLHAKVFSPEMKAGTLVLAAAGSLAATQCKDNGIAMTEIGAAGSGGLDLAAALRALYEAGIGSVLVEGGAGILGSLVRAGLWDAATIFVAPMFLGAGLDAVGDLGLESPDRAQRFGGVRYTPGPGYLRVDLKRDARRRF